MTTGRPLSPPPVLRIVTTEGRYLIGFFGGAPDWSAHKHHAKRFGCPLAAAAAQLIEDVKEALAAVGVEGMHPLAAGEGTTLRQVDGEAERDEPGGRGVQLGDRAHHQRRVRPARRVVAEDVAVAPVEDAEVVAADAAVVAVLPTASVICAVKVCKPSLRALVV